MKWYVRTGSGDVRGPMSQEDAEHECDRLDNACVFDERIFSSQLVTSEEVEAVVTDLRGKLQNIREDNERVEQCVVSPDPLSDSVSVLIQRAIDTIKLLSREKVVRGASGDSEMKMKWTNTEVEGLVSDLRGMKDGDMAVVVGGLSQLLERAIDALTSSILAKQFPVKEVAATLDGGVFDLDDIDKGVRLIVRDYDTENYSSDELKEDEDGRECKVLEYGS